jgi:glucokinase
MEFVFTGNLSSMNNQTIIGIDLGGTNIRAGLVKNGVASDILSKKINALGNESEVLQEVFSFVDQMITTDVKAIGIGFPGLATKGIAYDVYNIPSWRSVPLQKLMEARYHLPVRVDNDANCFALGEFYFGFGRGIDSMIGLTIGTGLGSGIIIEKKLYRGRNGGAGEFGMIPYLDKYFEYYASGQFFRNVYGTNGETVFKDAMSGDISSIKMYEELGKHLGNAIITILYSMDIPLIVFGGSLRHAYSLFEKSMWNQIQYFEFKRALKDLRIEISSLENSAVLGAAALHYNGGE